MPLRRQKPQEDETKLQALRRINRALQRATVKRNEQIAAGGATGGFGILGTETQDIRRAGSTTIRLRESVHVPQSVGERIGGVSERRLQRLASQLARDLRNERRRGR
jgi:hypothetical protein